MAKIIYRKGMKGQNKLSCIEGIEIDLLNGQQALIYPKYAERRILAFEQISKWGAKEETEIEALKVEDTNSKTEALLKISSPAAEWVSQFWSDKHSIFCLPSLLAALEIQHQKAEIDALAETIEGADLLIDFISDVVSCSKCFSNTYWYINGINGYAGNKAIYNSCLVVPTILYREEKI